MSGTVFNDITEAILGLLKKSPAVCNDIRRLPLRTLPKSQAEIIAVRQVSAKPRTPGVNPDSFVLWDTTIDLECTVRTGNKVAPDEAVDGLLGSTYERLMSDCFLGGMADGGILPVGIQWDADVAEEGAGCAVLRITVTHTHAWRTIQT